MSAGGFTDVVGSSFSGISEGAGVAITAGDYLLVWLMCFCLGPAIEIAAVRWWHDGV